MGINQGTFVAVAERNVRLCPTMLPIAANRRALLWHRRRVLLWHRRRGSVVVDIATNLIQDSHTLSQAAAVQKKHY